MSYEINAYPLSAEFLRTPHLIRKDVDLFEASDTINTEAQMAEYLQPTPANNVENACNGTEVRADRPVSLSESQGVLYDTNHRIELVPVSRLATYKGNARTHSRKQIRQIADSIKRFGVTNPLLVDNGGEIIAGPGRVAAAKLLGLNAVPTLPLSHLSATENRAYRLA